MLQKLTVIFFVFSLTTIRSLACFVAPEEIVWEKGQNEIFEFKRENRTGRITVYKVGDRDTPIWQTTVPKFRGLFSNILLTQSGKTIIHVRSNYQVKNLDDIAVQAFRQSGEKRRVYQVKDYIKKLQRSPKDQRSSADPYYLWIKGILTYNDNCLVIQTINGKTRTAVL